MGISLSLVRLSKKNIRPILYFISWNTHSHSSFCLKTHRKFKEINELPSSFLGKSGVSVQCCVAPPESREHLLTMFTGTQGQRTEGQVQDLGRGTAAPLLVCSSMEEGKVGSYTTFSCQAWNVKAKAIMERKAIQVVSGYAHAKMHIC